MEHEERGWRAYPAGWSEPHPKMIQEMLGHSSITITLDRYGHLFPNAHESLAERLDGTFVSAEAEQPVNNVIEIREAESR